ncbi:MAG: hypothetical protein ABSD75_25875 [Terriglobales bacterium]
MEALAAIDAVVLDKTGTLTFGTPQIHDVVSSDGFLVREIIAAASIAERGLNIPWRRQSLRERPISASRSLSPTGSRTRPEEASG